MVNARTFWSRVEIDIPTACWFWIGDTTPDGYGRIKFDGRCHRAHRVAYELAYGTIAPGLLVCHKCDNPLCCNPFHLFLGSPADNSGDMVSKNRQATGPRNGKYTHPEKRQYGENHPLHKLTRVQVSEIRSRRALGVAARQLGRDYGVTHKLIRDIVNQTIWKETNE